MKFIKGQVMGEGAHKCILNHKVIRMATKLKRLKRKHEKNKRGRKKTR